MNAKYKKSIKFISLAITALLIATASATTYKYLYIDGSITIGSQTIVWIKDGSTVTGDTVTMDFDVEPGVQSDETDRLYLNNADSSNAHNMTITVTTAVSDVTFEIFNICIYENNTASPDWTLLGTLDGTQQDDQYSTYTNNEPIVASGYFKLDFKIKPYTGTSGTVDFDIKVQYE